LASRKGRGRREVEKAGGGCFRVTGSAPALTRQDVEAWSVRPSLQAGGRDFAVTSISWIDST